jgi:hypothetical protein
MHAPTLAALRLLLHGNRPEPARPQVQTEIPTEPAGRSLGQSSKQQQAEPLPRRVAQPPTSPLPRASANCHQTREKPQASADRAHGTHQQPGRPPSFLVRCVITLVGAVGTGPARLLVLHACCHRQHACTKDILVSLVSVHSL